jgi:hypothetical protein
METTWSFFIWLPRAVETGLVLYQEQKNFEAKKKERPFGGQLALGSEVGQAL